MSMLAGPSSSRGAAAGVYELQLRRKLLKQQLGVVDDKCKRVAQIVAKKRIAKLARQPRALEQVVTGATAGQASCRATEQIRTPGYHRSSKNADKRQEGLQSVSADSYGVGEDSNAGVARSHKAEPTTKVGHGRGTPHPQDFLVTAAPFKKGGNIDHTNKKHILREKHREMEREAAAERRRRPTRKTLGVRDEVAAVPSAFPDRYLRGEVPCSKHCSVANALVWVCPLEQLDYDFYLPMFFDGIRCLEEPHKILARQGVRDLLSAARGHSLRILPSLPAIMRSIRLAISCRNPEVLVFVCGALRELASGNKEVGEALVKYYKMFLHVFNLFMNSTKSTGDRMDYGQRNNQDVGEAVASAIETLERHGGKNAFAHIKHCIPTYQTCVT